MKKVVLALILSFITAFAADSYKVVSDKVNVNWKAYKTFAKLGVKGSFDKVQLTAPEKAKNLTELLSGLSVVIETSSVNTNNPERDETLTKMFFGKLAHPTLKASVVSTEISKEKPNEGTVSVLIDINGHSIQVPMSFRVENGHISAVGNIDLFDFKAEAALASINKSCYDLHKGKTWNDVEIGFAFQVKHSDK